MYLPTWGSYEDIFVEDCTQLQCGDLRVKFIQAWMTDFSSDFYKHVQRSYNTYMKAKDTSYLLGDPVPFSATRPNNTSSSGSSLRKNTSQYEGHSRQEKHTPARSLCSERSSEEDKQSSSTWKMRLGSNRFAA